MIRVLVCVLTIAFAGTVFAADDAKKDQSKTNAAVTEKKKTEKEEGDHKRPDLQTLSGMAEMLKQSLTLTDEQFKKVKELADKGQKELDAKGEELRKIAEPLDIERGKDSPDLGKVKEGMEKRSKLMAEIEFLRYKFTFDCKPLLTAEQVEKWKEMRKKLEERIKSARDKRKDK